MVRRHLRTSLDQPSYTCKVEVFEADIHVCAWVPVTDGLDGSAPFVSQRFSKSVSGSEYGQGKMDVGAIYFVREVFHMRSATISSARWCLGFGEHVGFPSIFKLDAGKFHIFVLFWDVIRHQDCKVYLLCANRIPLHVGHFLISSK